MNDDCIFCARVLGGDLIAANCLFAAFWDRYPVSPGHALVVPLRHCEGFFDLDPSEASALHEFVDLTRAAIEKTFRPDGYNIGANSGAAAGQSVFHLHIHVIPRYWGDAKDPRGGLRALFPAEMRYWDRTDS